MLLIERSCVSPSVVRIRLLRFSCTRARVLFRLGLAHVRPPRILRLRELITDKIISKGLRNTAPAPSIGLLCSTQNIPAAEDLATGASRSKEGPVVKEQGTNTVRTRRCR